MHWLLTYQVHSTTYQCHAGYSIQASSTAFPVHLDWRFGLRTAQNLEAHFYVCYPPPSPPSTIGLTSILPTPPFFFFFTNKERLLRTPFKRAGYAHFENTFLVLPGSWKKIVIWMLWICHSRRLWSKLLQNVLLLAHLGYMNMIRYLVPSAWLPFGRHFFFGWLKRFRLSFSPLKADVTSLRLFLVSDDLLVAHSPDLIWLALLFTQFILHRAHHIQPIR